MCKRSMIDELSPIAKARENPNASDNPATTNNVGYSTFKKYSDSVHPWKRKNISNDVAGLHQEIIDFYKVRQLEKTAKILHEKSCVFERRRFFNRVRTSVHNLTP